MLPSLGVRYVNIYTRPNIAQNKNSANRSFVVARSLINANCVFSNTDSHNNIASQWIPHARPVHTGKAEATALIDKILETETNKELYFNDKVYDILKFSTQ